MMPAAFRFPGICILSAVLFALGVAGFLFRRNIITVFMSIELMLNAVNLSFHVLLSVQAGRTATFSRSS